MFALAYGCDARTGTATHDTAGAAAAPACKLFQSLANVASLVASPLS